MSTPKPILRILIVDDNPDYVRAMRNLLNEKISRDIPEIDIQIDNAPSLEGGLLLAPHANCTILDLGLSDSDPVDTIRAISRFRPPVIVLTGTDDPEIHKACVKRGADHVFVKGQTHGICQRVLDCMMRDVAGTAKAPDAPAK